MLTNFFTFFPKGKKAVDWFSPQMLTILILAVLLGFLFLLFVYKKIGGTIIK